MGEKHAQRDCPVLVGFVSSPAAGGAKKKSITPHGHFNAADSNRRLLPARPDLLGGSLHQNAVWGTLHSNRCISAATWMWADGRLRVGTPGVKFRSCTFLNVQIQKNRWISRPPRRTHGALLWRPGCPIGTFWGQTRRSRTYPSKPHGKPAVRSESTERIFEILNLGLRAAKSRKKTRGSPRYEPRG